MQQQVHQTLDSPEVDWTAIAVAAADRAPAKLRFDRMHVLLGWLQSMLKPHPTATPSSLTRGKPCHTEVTVHVLCIPLLIANVGQCTPEINLNGMVGGAYDHLKGCCSTLVSNLKLDQQ